jgi:fermentation-respiration switch protein FrsA (DUF1100 family)
MAHFTDRLIFAPPPSSYDGQMGGLVRLPTATGDTVAGLLATTPEAPLTVVFTHGNAEDIGDLRDFVATYRTLGVSVLAVEYPGYGLSTGRPTESGAYAAGDAALAWLADNGVPPGRVVLHGRSLGGAVSVDLATRHPVAGLILESTFTSAFQVMLPLAGLPGDRFTSLAKLPGVTAPTLVIHGRRDEVVPFRHGRQLAEALPPAQVSSWWVDDAGHNDLLLVAGDAYWGRLRAFLAQVANPGTGRGQGP